MAKVIEFVSDHLERRKRIQDRLGEMITFEFQRPGQWSGADLEILGSLNAVVPDGKIASTVISLLQVGNANEDSLADTWKGERYSRYRELHENMRRSELNPCDRCPL